MRKTSILSNKTLIELKCKEKIIEFEVSEANSLRSLYYGDLWKSCRCI